MSSVVVLGAHTALGRVLTESLTERLSDVRVVAATTTEHIGPNLDLIDQKLLESSDVAVFAFSGGFASKLADGLKVMSKYVIDAAGACENAPLVFPRFSNKALPTLLKEKIVRTPVSMVGPVTGVLRALEPFGLTAARIVTLESAAGLGQPGIDELSEQIRSMFGMVEPQSEQFYSTLAFNILPSVGEGEDPYSPDDDFLDDVSEGLSNEPDIQVTRLRVPTVSVETAILHIDLEDAVEEEIIYQVFDKAPGIRRTKLPAPSVLDAVDRDDTLLFRLRVMGSKLQVSLATDRFRSGGATQAALLVESFISRVS